MRERRPSNWSSALQELRVSVPESSTGKILWLPLLPGYRGFELACELEKQTGIRRAVENDANLAAVAELWLDETADLKDVVVLAACDFGGGGGNRHRATRQRYQSRAEFEDPRFQELIQAAREGTSGLSMDSARGSEISRSVSLISLWDRILR